MQKTMAQIQDIAKIFRIGILSNCKVYEPSSTQHPYETVCQSSYQQLLTVGYHIRARIKLNHSFMQFATPWFKIQHSWIDLSPGEYISLIATKKALKMLGYTPFWGFTGQHFARINLQILEDGHEKTIRPREIKLHHQSHSLKSPNPNSWHTRRIIRLPWPCNSYVMTLCLCMWCEKCTCERGRESRSQAGLKLPRQGSKLATWLPLHY